MIRVGIADDHHLVRQGTIQLLQDVESIEVVLQAENGKDLLNQVDNTPIDIVLMDLNMPIMDGYEATAILKEKYPNVKSIGLSQHSGIAYVAHFLKVGGKGFILKNIEQEDLIKAICDVHQKGFYHNRLAADAMLASMSQGYHMKPHFPDHPFSKIEIQILNLICAGKSSEQIADELNKSKRTIENQRRIMMSKVQAKNAVDLVIISLQMGFIELSDFNPLR